MQKGTYFSVSNNASDIKEQLAQFITAPRNLQSITESNNTESIILI